LRERGPDDIAGQVFHSLFFPGMDAGAAKNLKILLNKGSLKMNSKFTKILGIISLLSISLVSAARAEGITVSVGRFDHSDNHPKSEMLQLDYDFDKVVFKSAIGDFKPVVGFLITADQAKFGYAGFRLDYKLANNSFVISPSFTPGIYSRGDGKDLGHALEFKTQIRAALNVGSNANIGVGYSHISNAGLAGKNPGANNYSISFQKLF
jgi:lipid A 3-O-deacylase